MNEKDMVNELKKVKESLKNSGYVINGLIRKLEKKEKE